MNYTALHHTTGQRHDSTVQILFESGIDINVQSCYGHTALFQAVGSGHEDTVRLFLEHGADVRITSNAGWSVLHLATFHGYVPIAALLLDHGADINGESHGVTPLHIAVLRRDIDFVEFLLEYDADVTLRNSYGDTVADFLDLEEPDENKDRLLTLGIEHPTATITGLRIAASLGRDVRIRQLLERGADINAKDEGGMTALLWAVEKGHVSTMKLLVEN
jgi:ankyrin repeat protein